MTVSFDSCPLPNQSGDHRLVFSEPVLNSSSGTGTEKGTEAGGAPAVATDRGAVAVDTLPLVTVMRTPVLRAEPLAVAAPETSVYEPLGTLVVLHSHIRPITVFVAAQIVLPASP
jgi:hypothetical protein